MFPIKVTVSKLVGSLYPENIVGVNESDAVHEEMPVIPVHCKLMPWVKVIFAPFTTAPLPKVKKTFTGPSELLALMSIGLIVQD